MQCILCVWSTKTNWNNFFTFNLKHRSQLKSSWPTTLHVLDISLLQHTCLKRTTGFSWTWYSEQVIQVFEPSVRNTKNTKDSGPQGAALGISDLIGKILFKRCQVAVKLFKGFSRSYRCQTFGISDTTSFRI